MRIGSTLMKDLRTAFLLLAVLALSAAGCGYRFSGEGPGPRPGLHRVAIPLFENDTAEPGLETLFAGELRREFLTRGSMEATSEGEAEAVFRGRVVNIYTVEVAHRDVEETIESRLYVTLNIHCEDAETKSVLWSANGFSYYEEYFQNEDPMVSYENRRQALEVIAREMAVRIHDRFLSNF